MKARLGFERARPCAEVISALNVGVITLNQRHQFEREGLGNHRRGNPLILSALYAARDGLPSLRPIGGIDLCNQLVRLVRIELRLRPFAHDAIATSKS